MVFDTVRHSNVQKKPAYRLIRKYTKSNAKYKAEKSRRKQVVALQEQGFTLRQIARRQSVSVSTVKRDLHRFSLYLKGKEKVYRMDVYDEFRQEFFSRPLNKQADYVVRMQKLFRKIQGCKALVVTWDVDAALKGCCPLRFEPRLPVQLLGNSRVTFELAIGGRTQILARAYVTQASNRDICLGTNDSILAFVKEVLGGLRVEGACAVGADLDYSI